MISKFDEWIKERLENNTFWIAHLSNGEELYEDNDRYDEPSFVRLKKYVESNNLSIEKLFLRFRSHWELVYDGSGDGLFFRRGVKGGLFSKNTYFYTIGKIEDNKIYCKKWHIPELMIVEEEVRDLDTEEGVIWNTKTN